MDYKLSAQKIIEQLGGVENIRTAAHCMTRLRLSLHDDAMFNEANTKNIEVVKGVNQTGEQLQIILGTGVVNKVYKEVMAIINSTGTELDEAAEGGNAFQRLSRVFGDVFIPIIPVIIASGILLGLKSFLLSAGWLTTDSPWFDIANVVIDTGFAFLPVLVAWSATKKFGGTPALGILIGLMLIAPQLPSPAAVARGTAEPIWIEIFGYTYGLVGFHGSILVAVGAGLLLSMAEKLFSRIVPDVIDMIATPILAVVTTFFVIFFGIGPILNVMEGWLVSFFEWLFLLPVGIGGFIIGGLQQVLVITGLHHALWIIDIQFIEQTGTNLYQPIRNASVLGQTGAVFAFVFYAMRHNYKQIRPRAMAAGVSGMFGITEPVIFGFTLNYGKPFLFGCLGSAVGGMFSTAIGLSAPGMGAAGVAGLLYFLGDTTDLALYIIQSIITMVIPFVLTYIYLERKRLDLSDA
ncbi:PTS transporter subunit EIIC [Vibrio parahaemolyticus]|nr:PTS transporter subunit EIIC [Vibrio parahaemolyticus]